MRLKGEKERDSRRGFARRYIRGKNHRVLISIAASGSPGLQPFQIPIKCLNCRLNILVSAWPSPYDSRFSVLDLFRTFKGVGKLNRGILMDWHGICFNKETSGCIISPLYFHRALPVRMSVFQLSSMATVIATSTVRTSKDPTKSQMFFRKGIIPSWVLQRPLAITTGYHP